MGVQSEHFPSSHLPFSCLWFLISVHHWSFVIANKLEPPTHFTTVTAFIVIDIPHSSTITLISAHMVKADPVKQPVRSTAKMKGHGHRGPLTVKLFQTWGDMWGPAPKSVNVGIWTSFRSGQASQKVYCFRECVCSDGPQPKDLIMTHWGTREWWWRLLDEQPER